MYHFAVEPPRLGRSVIPLFPPSAPRLGPAGEPLLKRSQALARGLAHEEVGDADVLVKGGPMNALAAADQTPGIALFGRGVEKTGIPRERSRNAAAIGKLHGQCVLTDLNVRGPRG